MAAGPARRGRRTTGAVSGWTARLAARLRRRGPEPSWRTGSPLGPAPGWWAVRAVSVVAAAAGGAHAWPAAGGRLTGPRAARRSASRRAARSVRCTSRPSAAADWPRSPRTAPRSRATGTLTADPGRRAARGAAGTRRGADLVVVRVRLTGSRRAVARCGPARRVLVLARDRRWLGLLPGAAGGAVRPAGTGAGPAGRWLRCCRCAVRHGCVGAPSVVQRSPAGCARLRRRGGSAAAGRAWTAAGPGRR